MNSDSCMYVHGQLTAAFSYIYHNKVRFPYFPHES